MSDVSCIWCRQTDRNDYLHNTNHGGRFSDQRCCTAQYLRRNHLRYMVAHGSAEQVAEYLARFLELWAHRPADDWAREAAAARARLAKLNRIEHTLEPHGVGPSEELALW